MRLRLSIFLWGFLLPAAATPVWAASGLKVQEVSFQPEQWLSPNEVISIGLDQIPDPTTGRIRVMIGTTDLTDLFERSGPGVLSYRRGSVPLPAGESELAVFFVDPKGEWEEIDRRPIKVLTTTGYQKAEFAPVFDVNIKSQIDEGTSGDAPPPEREGTNADLAFNGGFTTQHVKNGFTADTAVNLVGTSRREEALRFGEKGESAPYIDLSDYIVNLSSQGYQFSLGHITYGNHPLLVDSVSNRGFSVRKPINDWFDFSVSSQSGRALAGFERVLGFVELEDRISAATAGFNLLPNRSGDLRLEVSLMDAELNTKSDFDAGQVTDREKGSGYGLRIIGTDPSGRLRGDAAYARSKFTNPEDENLSQGTALVPVEEVTQDAYYGEVAYDIFKDRAFSGERTANLTARIRAERADALYRSAAAAPTPDQEMYTFSLDGLFGDVAAQYQYQNMEDNVEDIATILKTKTRNHTFGVVVPIRSVAKQPDNFWLPKARYNYVRTKQFGANTPPEFDDPASQIPDQVNDEHKIGLEWNSLMWDLIYTLTSADQDNRQLGRANADFETVTHAVDVNVRPTNDLSLTFGVSRITQDNIEEQKENRTNSFGFGFDWRFIPNWALRGNYTVTDESDSLNISDVDNFTTDTQITWSFTVPFAGRKLPGQLFLRHAYSDSSTVDNALGVNTDARTWVVNGGVNISLF